jgi:hypothetical protein
VRCFCYVEYFEGFIGMHLPSSRRKLKLHTLQTPSMILEQFGSVVKMIFKKISWIKIRLNIFYLLFRLVILLFDSKI